MAKTKTEEIIDKLRTEIIEKVSIKLSGIKETTIDVRTAWNSREIVAAKEIREILGKYLKDSKITSPKSKSTYPDVKIENSEGLFAIDIKCSEHCGNPWFDICRLDTMQTRRIDKYVEEWELVIKYDSGTGKFLKAYFLLLREVVGLRKECDGIKYRPYDGKVRPKTWQEFDDCVVHWDTKEKFLTGMKKSIKHRWIENIKSHLIPILNEEEKENFKKLFDE